MKIIITVILASVLFTACTPAVDTPIQGAEAPQTMEAEQPVAPVETPASTPEETTVDDTTEDETPEEAKIIKTAVITSGEHGVSATVNLYSDNKLEITGFNYDGKAPDTYVALGNKTEDDFEKTALVSDKITEAQADTSLEIMLEDGLDYNSVSIYCSIFAEDFGSAIFEDVE